MKRIRIGRALKWALLTLAAMVAISLLLDTFEPQFWVEHKARIEVEDRARKGSVPPQPAGGCGEI